MTRKAPSLPKPRQEARLSHHQHRPLRQPRQKLSQIFRAQSDAAGGWGEIWPRAMQKYGAALAFSARPQIVVEDDDEVIETVVAPQFFAIVATGQAHGSIVGRRLWIVAPAVGRLDRLQRPRCDRPCAGRPEKSANEAKMPGWGREISLAFAPTHRGGTDGAGKAREAGTEPAAWRSLKGRFGQHNGCDSAQAFRRAFRRNKCLRRRPVGRARHCMAPLRILFGLEHRSFVIWRKEVPVWLASSRRIDQFGANPDGAPPPRILAFANELICRDSSARRSTLLL